MRFFKQSLIVSLKVIKSKIILLSVIIIATVAVSQIAVIFLSDLFSSGAYKLDIALVNLDNGQNMQALLDVALANDLIEDDFNVTVYSSVEEAMSLNPPPVAIGIFPDKMLDSVINGQNLSPTLIINNNDPLISTIVENFADSWSEVLKNSQTGVYSVLDFGRPLGYDNTAFILDINFDYITYIVDSEEIFFDGTLPYSNTISLTQHYVLSFVVFLLFLGSIIFFDDINFQKNKKFLKHIYSAKANFQIFYFTKLMVLFALFFCIFAFISFFFGAYFSLYYIISLLNASLFFVLLQCVIFNFSSNFVAVAGISFTLQSAFLVLAGGVIPTVLMPNFFLVLQNISPIYHLRNIFSAGLTNFPDSISSNIILLLINIILVFGIYLFNSIKIKGDTYCENI